MRTIRCRRCGQDKPHHGHGLCNACQRAERRATVTVTNHGYSGYADGCRCGVCTEAKREYMGARRGEGYLAGHVVPDGVTHGARSTFEEHGCRCPECVAAQVARGRASAALAGLPRGAA